MHLRNDGIPAKMSRTREAHTDETFFFTWYVGSSWPDLVAGYIFLFMNVCDPYSCRVGWALPPLELELSCWSSTVYRSREAIRISPVLFKYEIKCPKHNYIWFFRVMLMVVEVLSLIRVDALFSISTAPPCRHTVSSLLCCITEFCFIVM